MKSVFPTLHIESIQKALTIEVKIACPIFLGNKRLKGYPKAAPTSQNNNVCSVFSFFSMKISLSSSQKPDKFALQPVKTCKSLEHYQLGFY